MRVAIIFGSRHGTTEAAACNLQKRLQEHVEIISVDHLETADLKRFDLVILGASIYMGHIQAAMKEFIERHLKVLLSKQVGLYLCCMLEGEMADKQFEQEYPQTLRDHALVTGVFGGEIHKEKLDEFDRLIIDIVEGESALSSGLLDEEIRVFADVINLWSQKEGGAIENV
ncbi:flavodoxin domain-containing protein [Amphibacillus marinus]|uniref:flavodoxin domain-containing protein n=1 Tax=Amphibacillus marinus TaxID=872970 RepID=UPI0015A547C0|nr:flavodoxin domain-containing protein [Amphibacillus marinus]